VKKIQITPADLHPHLQARMNQRGISRDEIEQTLNEGWDAIDVKPGILGKVMVFLYQAEWTGRFYQEKEVTVYYKRSEEGLILLTAKARYGQGFPRGVNLDED
jgi:hypothetical protein